MVLSRNFEKSYLQMAAGWKGWLDKHMPNCKRKEKFKERVDLVVLSTKGNLFYRYTPEFMHRMAFGPLNPSWFNPYWQTNLFWDISETGLLENSSIKKS